MTLIAGFSIEKRPVLMGDLILSGPELADRSISVPTVDDSRNVFPEGSGTVLTGITQKVSVLSDNFMIAWSGRAYVARTVIRELMELASREPLNFQRLDRFLEHFRQSKDGHSAQFIGCLIDDSKTISFSLGGERFDTPHWGHVRTAGTGSEDGKNVFTRFEVPQAPDGSQTTYVDAILRALMVTGHLLQVELSTYSTLLQYYGGGYEIATLINGRFQKIGNICYLFWDISVTDDGVGLSYPYHAVKIEYLNDILVMRTARIGPDLSFKDAGYVVSPLLRQVTRSEIQDLKPPDMNAPYLVNLFLVKWPDGSSGWMSRADYMPPPSKYIVFQETGDGFEISFENSFMENIGQAVVDRLKAKHAWR